MKVSLNWLKELVEYNLTPKELAEILSLTSIGVKQYTNDYLELDLTYNRGDLLSLRGVAREIAAITGSKLLFSADNPPIYPKSTTPVQIEDEKLSPIQCVAKIEGLKVGPSDQRWVKKLADSGMRSVNNLVDVTNLIMLEFGQPFHAFDAQRIKGETIIVRTAKNGEEIATLDNKLRKLSSQDIVLADTEKPVDVAGVMGGKDTEVKESTESILLSASMFNPSTIRQTSKRLGLYSEASRRFLHGLTKTNLLQALSAAIKMYESLGGKLIAISLTGDLKDQPKVVKLTQEKLNNLLGVNIKANFVESSLKKLGFMLASQGRTLSAWEVEVPYWRLDVNIEEDLIEEVARMYGYDKIEGQPLKDETTQKLDQTFYKFIYDLKNTLKDAGLTEVQTYSFYSTNVLSHLDWDKSKLVKIANPISSETQYLRDDLWPNLLEVVAKNIRNGFKDVAIFEIGKVYSPQKGNLPSETYRLAIALSNSTDNPINELNQIAQNLPGLQLSKDGILTKNKLFHPTRFSKGIAEVHLRVLNKLGIEKRAAVLEVDI